MKRVRTALGLGLILVLALSGGAFPAAKVTGAQIKDSTITGKDVKNESLTPADFNGSVQGPQLPDPLVPPARASWAS
jgi:uncharacterized protein YjbI with pentapeptide repeats